MTDLQEAMKQNFRLISRDSEEDEEDDIALIAFKRNCHNFGTPGHVAKDCRKIKTNMKFNGSCNGCGKSGHDYKDCWLNKANAKKRPRNFVSEARVLETNASHTDDPPEIALTIADNDDSSLVTDTEHCVY